MRQFGCKFWFGWTCSTRPDLRTPAERPSNKDLKTINQRIRRLEEENCKKKDQLEAVAKRLKVVKADRVQTTEHVLLLEHQLAQALANNRKLTARVDLFEKFEFEWGFYALSASKAIFRARTYNCITYSVR